jgi:myo-inositol-1(or 4)-monophosphatase
MSTPLQRKNDKQLLHIVIGGELEDVNKVYFKDLHALDFIGAFPDHASAYSAWKSAAQQTVDNAHMRYFIIHAHRLIDPEHDHHED